MRLGHREHESRDSSLALKPGCARGLCARLPAARFRRPRAGIVRLDTGASVGGGCSVVRRRRRGSPGHMSEIKIRTIPGPRCHPSADSTPSPQVSVGTARVPPADGESARVHPSGPQAQQALSRCVPPRPLNPPLTCTYPPARRKKGAFDPDATPRPLNAEMIMVDLRRCNFCRCATSSRRSNRYKMLNDAMSRKAIAPRLTQTIDGNAQRGRQLSALLISLPRRRTRLNRQFPPPLP